MHSKSVLRAGWRLAHRIENNDCQKEQQLTRNNRKKGKREKTIGQDRQGDAQNTEKATAPVVVVADPIKNQRAADQNDQGKHSYGIE